MSPGDEMSGGEDKPVVMNRAELGGERAQSETR